MFIDTINNIINSNMDEYFTADDLNTFLADDRIDNEWKEFGDICNYLGEDDQLYDFNNDDPLESFGSPNSDRSDPSTSNSVDSGYGMDFECNVPIKIENDDSFEPMQENLIKPEMQIDGDKLSKQPRAKLVAVKLETLKQRSIGNTQRIQPKGIRLSKFLTFDYLSLKIPSDLKGLVIFF